jgi:hypothetical protein
MGPKTGKKAKGETPEEKAAKEEEARKLKELEDKRIAEEIRHKEIEEAKLRAQKKALREEELVRLSSELSICNSNKEKCTIRMQQALAQQVICYMQI